VGRGAPIQTESAQSVTTGPQRESEGVTRGLGDRVIQTPDPAEVGSREAEPSVHKTFTVLEVQPSARDLMGIGQKEVEITLDKLFAEVELIDILCR